MINGIKCATLKTEIHQFHSYGSHRRLSEQHLPLLFSQPCFTTVLCSYCFMCWEAIFHSPICFSIFFHCSHLTFSSFSVPILSIFLAAAATSITVPLITSVVLLPLPIQLVLFDSCYLLKKCQKQQVPYIKNKTHEREWKIETLPYERNGCKVGESFGALVTTRQSG